MNRVFIFGSVLIVLLAASLRVYHIAQRSLWLDEAIAANISRDTLAETLVLTRGLHSAPVTHPLVLYAVEKVASGPLAVRLPSLAASLLAVCSMLCFAAIPSIGPKAATLSALMLSVSAVQIRYAQEVREYSASVFFAGLLLYLYMSYVSNSQECCRPPIGLFLALFAAPLIQYGLALFGFGIIAALFAMGLAGSRPRVKISQLVTGSLFFASGGLLSYVLTLRYQWEPKSYLQDYYFSPGSSLPGFVWSNTHDLLTFFLPGRAAALLSAVAIVFRLVTWRWHRTDSPLLILAFTSFATVAGCAILRLYPYGPTRQCLFLTPVLCLLASATLVQMADRFSGEWNRAVFLAIVCVVLVSSVSQVRALKPYAEIEDIQSVLLELRSHIAPGDGVYVYSGAVPALDFYVKERDPRFAYGDFHREEPGKYVPEMLADLPQGTSRVWVVLSHIFEDEDQRILRDLGSDWEVKPALFAKGTALYLACRRGAPVIDLAANRNFRQGDTAPTPGVHRPRDSFLDWNIRKSRQQAH